MNIHLSHTSHSFSLLLLICCCCSCLSFLLASYHYFTVARIVVWFTSESGHSSPLHIIFNFQFIHFIATNWMVNFNSAIFRCYVLIRQNKTQITIVCAAMKSSRVWNKNADARIYTFISQILGLPVFRSSYLNRIW